MSGFSVDPPPLSLHKATAVPNVTQITAVSWEEIENKNGNEALKRKTRERAERQNGCGLWADVDGERRPPWRL